MDLEVERLCGAIKATAVSDPIRKFCQTHKVSSNVAKFYLAKSGGDMKIANQFYMDSPPPVLTFVYEMDPVSTKSVPPNSYVKKSWRVKNGGQQCWPLGCKLISVGEGMDMMLGFEIPPLPSKEEGTVTLTFISPKISGYYNYVVKMVTAENLSFEGETLWGIFEVDETIDATLEIAENLQRAKLR